MTTVGVAVSGSVLDNDTDPDAELLMVTMVDGNPIGVPIMTANGLVVMAADGTYTYTQIQVSSVLSLLTMKSVMPRATV